MISLSLFYLLEFNKLVNLAKNYNMNSEKSKPKPEIEYFEHEKEIDDVEFNPSGLDSIDGYTEDYIMDLSPVDIEPDKLQKIIEDTREHVLGLFETYDIATRDQIISYQEDDEDDEWEDEDNIIS